MLIPASFWRGGTSRGLIVPYKALRHLPHPERERIILKALGSPDADGRQISGLGGGVSSLSKVCIVSVPSEEQSHDDKWPGLDIPTFLSSQKHDIDIIYRFGQVAVKEASIDWSITCGNMLAAVASHSLSLLSPNQISQKLQPSPHGTLLDLPLRILAANTGAVLKATLPIDPMTKELWQPQSEEGFKMAGVPDLDAAPIQLEFPVAEEGPLPTGKPLDTISFEGREVKLSIINAGLPNIFVTPASLGLPEDLCTLSPTELDSYPNLHTKLESLRKAASQLSPHLASTLSPAAPKINLISKPLNYTTTSDNQVTAAEVDLLSRTVSVGDFHKSIPGTTLSALNVARAIPATLVSELCGYKEGLVGVRVGNPAGVVESMVKRNGEEMSVVMIRTAREIMRGHVLV